MSTDPRLPAFVQLSSLLTGFSADVLAPTPDPVHLAPTYLAFAADRVGPPLDQLLDAFQQASGGTAVADMTADQKTAIGTQLLTPADEPVGQTAQAVMKLWYLGSWYQPFAYNGHEPDLMTGYVVSQKAYTRGLSWQVMQSHAMGDSNLTFGYWAAPPKAPLDVFTGNPAPSSS